MYTHYIIGRLKKYRQETQEQKVLQTKIKMEEIALLHRQDDIQKQKAQNSLFALQQRRHNGRQYIHFARSVLDGLDDTDKEILTQFYIHRNIYRVQELTQKYKVDYAILMQMKQDALHRASLRWRRAEKQKNAKLSASRTQMSFVQNDKNQ